MGKRLYIGNLSYSTTDEHLNQLFAQHGKIESATVMTDRYTGRSRGFGFVEYASDEEAKKAVSALDGHMVDGRALKVNEARERTESRPPRAGGGMGGGTGGGMGGGGDRGDRGGNRDRGDQGDRGGRW